MEHRDHEPVSFWRSPAGLGLPVIAMVGGFLLYTEHRAHVLGVLPYLVLFACPLMHVFLHRGHHHGGHSAHRPGSGDDERRE